MSRARSLRQKLLTDQVVLILVLGGVLTAATFSGARRAVETLAATAIQSSADQAELELRLFFDPVATGLLTLRSWGEAGLLDPDPGERLTEIVGPLGDRLGQAEALLLADAEGRTTVLRHHDDGWRAADPGTEDPRREPWYEGALARRGEVFWSDPDAASPERAFLTASLAYDTGDGGVHVVAFRLPLAGLERFSRGIEVSERGDLWVLTDARRLLAWPDDPGLWQGQDPAGALLRLPRDLGLRRVDDAVEALRSRAPNQDLGQPVRFPSGGEDWWALGRPFALSGERGLMIAVLLPHDDLLGDRARLRVWILAVTLAALAAAVGRAFFLARGVSRPIEALVRESDRISQGDLDPGRPILTPLSEVRQLADAHERMRRGLVTLMKLESDLQLARQLQQRTFPRELPRLAGFDLVAWSQPADETGGDTYDVIGLDGDGTIVDGDAEASSAILLLADATGHGVGPALSVTQLRSMLRMAVRLGGDLQGMATHVNEQLYADLPDNRFITAWLAKLTVEGSVLRPFSAGQAPLLHYQAAGDQMDVLKADAPPLGLLPALPILLPPPIVLRPGDVYAVFSDGFFEAADASEMELGTDRVVEVIRRHRRASAAEILAVVRATLEEFTGGAPADDDRTALVVKRQG